MLHIKVKLCDRINKLISKERLHCNVLCLLIVYEIMNTNVFKLKLPYI